MLWFSRRQKSIALSSAEAEYMAASQDSCEALWLRKLMVDLFDQELRPIVIHCDNQSCIRLSENPVFHDKSKHIDIGVIGTGLESVKPAGPIGLQAQPVRLGA